MSNTTKVSKITNIIQVMHSGVEFYEDAMSSVESSHVKRVFLKMIRTKNAIIESLQPFAVVEQGEREDGNSLAVDARKVYAKVANIFSSNTEHTFVDQLEEVEDKVLEVIDDALSEDQPAHTLAKLREVRMESKRMHDEMKALQEATEH